MPTTFKSDLITTKDSANVSDKQHIGALPLVTERVSYTLLGTEAANDLIDLFDLPAGATLIPQLCSVDSADPGTTLTLHVGDSADGDRYANGLALSAGGLINFCSGTIPDGVVNPYTPTAQSRVFATLTGAGTLSAGVKLSFLLVYRIKG